MKSIIFLFSLAFLLSCSRVQTLNLKTHSYSERPNHIVWFQIAGLSEEHLPLLRFNVSDALYRSEIEKMDCVGKMWNFNLYELRPSANKSFLSQITGSKNIKNTCDDYIHTPVWAHLENIGYDVSILENGATKDESLLEALACKDNNMIDLTNIRYYSMSDKGDAETFHYQDNQGVSARRSKPGLYYDKSCQKDNCFSTVGNNFKALWNQFHKERGRSLFVVRDFNYQKALVKKDISLVRESLQEIDRMVQMLNETNRSDLLIVITSGAATQIEFPAQGQEWLDFVKSGKNVIYKKPSLMSPVFAKGAIAENFCGVFDESETLKRLLFKPQEKVFNIDNILPF